MMLRKMVEERDYVGALAIISELDEMVKDDKITKVESFLHILLLHLIKQNAEQRTTKSWNKSIQVAARSIQKSNKRRSAGGSYLKSEELLETIDESFPDALEDAAYEAFEGIYSAEQLAAMINPTEIKQKAIELIKP